jgi:hypothetical protein
LARISIPEQVVEVLFGEVSDARDVDDGGVGEQYVDGLSTVCDGRVQPVEVFRLGHVALYGDDAVTEFLGRLVEFGLPAPGDEHRGAFGDESLRGRQADARRAHAAEVFRAPTGLELTEAAIPS